MNDTYNNLETNEAQCLQQIQTQTQTNAQTNNVEDEETTAFCINM